MHHAHHTSSHQYVKNTHTHIRTRYTAGSRKHKKRFVFHTGSGISSSPYVAQQQRRYPTIKIRRCASYLKRPPGAKASLRELLSHFPPVLPHGLPLLALARITAITDVGTRLAGYTKHQKYQPMGKDVRRHFKLGKKYAGKRIGPSNPR